MKALLTGVYGIYTAATTSSLYVALYKSATRKGLYPDVVPQSETFPYCVYGLHNGVFDDSMTDEADYVTVYFNLYTQTGPAAALDLVGYLTTLFDDAALSVTGYDALFMVRDTIVPVHDLSDDTPIYGYAVHYDVHLES